MRLTPRGTEVKAVVALLESEDYDSADALAKDVIKTVWEHLLQRDLWVLGHQPFATSPAMPYGPFSSEKEGERFAKSAELTGPSLAVPMFSPGQALARHDERAEQWRLMAAGHRPTCACGHPTFVHEHNGYGGKCAMRGCNCKKFTEIKEA